MQNHANKRLNRTSVNAMAAIAIGAMLVFSVAGTKAFADVLQADALESSNLSVSVEEGKTTDVEYRLVANGPEGCNVDDTHPATVKLTVSTADGVSASPNPFEMKKCVEGPNNNAVTISFTGETTGGPYSIDASITGGKSGNNGYNDNQADGLAVTVTEPKATSDTTPPKFDPETLPSITVKADGDDTVTNGKKVTYTVKATDNVDGSATLGEDNQLTQDSTGGDITIVCEPPSGSLFGIGQTEVKCTATDVAGNSAVGTFNVLVTIEAVGFYQPVDNNGVLNAGQAGRAYPLKFEVFGDKNIPSTEITLTSVIAVNPPKFQKVSCTSGQGEDALETTASSGSTELRYDTSGGQFIYNWKTPTTKNTCYRVDIVLIEDMGTLSALFKLR